MVGDSGGQCTPFNNPYGPEAPPERGSLLPSLRIRMGGNDQMKDAGLRLFSKVFLSFGIS